MVSMVLVPYGINPNFDIVPRVMVTSLRRLSSSLSLNSQTLKQIESIAPLHTRVIELSNENELKRIMKKQFSKQKRLKPKLKKEGFYSGDLITNRKFKTDKTDFLKKINGQSKQCTRVDVNTSAIEDK
ncbi:hypothetical protein BpHYR1_016775 [Brachionus plicatilis]|uniref:Uncharacterized protein n=1 Tax=Brachionus plicatilis TaxID=10195 RepID=A0A3M7PNU8_BRAPC|nr:hypothetical protein BpHYR1_016775 [Brachionus plicatilis]